LLHNLDVISNTMSC